MLSIFPLRNFKNVVAGDDVARLIVAAFEQLPPQEDDIVVVTSKILSKANACAVELETVLVSEAAVELASKTNKDPRLVELIIRESTHISRALPDVLITRHRLGFISANAAIDRSNVGPDEGGDLALLMPEDPDREARQIRDAIHVAFGVTVGVVITDSHGRPFRRGTVGFAVGVAGIMPVWDQRGGVDLFGRELVATMTGLADQVAAAADLVAGQAAEGTPVVVVRGLNYPRAESGAGELLRDPSTDLYA